MAYPRYAAPLCHVIEKVSNVPFRLFQRYPKLLCHCGSEVPWTLAPIEQSPNKCPCCIQTEHFLAIEVQHHNLVAKLLVRDQRRCLWM